MSLLTISLGLAVALVVLGWWWLHQRQGRQGIKTAERIDTVIGWPPEATRVLSTPERLAYGALARGLPEYMILAQVPLSRFLNVPRRNSYADWLRRVGNQCADFVVCDMAAQVIAVVEVQGAQPGERARKRLARIARTLKAAKIPLQIWSEAAIPAAEVARALVLPQPPAAASTESASSSAAAPAAAVPAAKPISANPFEDADRDSTQDEMIEMLEPPPSTWYDDLETEPAPLGKR
jgi:hypothetical protein